MLHTEEEREYAFCTWAKGRRHKQYEDRFCLLTNDIPIIKAAQKGEIVGVLDGVGGAPQGMAAAQEVCDYLRYFYTKPALFSNVQDCLQQANDAIHLWGMMPDSDRPLGACAGTIVNINPQKNLSTWLQVGDTSGFLWRAERFVFKTVAQQLGDGSLANYYGHQTFHATVTEQTLQEDDWIILTSDGITKSIGSKELAMLLADCHDPIDACETVAKHALHRGATDDITILIYEVLPDM